MAKRHRSQKSEVRSQKRDLAPGEELHVGANLPQKSAAPSNSAKPPVDLSLLTPRQLEVLRCFVDTPHEPPIARRLGMRVKTVEVHLYNIQRKLNVPCRVELMKTALFAFSDSIRDGTTIRDFLTTRTPEKD